MRGNYQEEAPPMKFTPEAAEQSEIYQVQQYTHLADESEFADNYSLTITDPDNKAV